jgi:thiol-disulfide isomerase/thioredoxin
LKRTKLKNFMIYGLDLQSIGHFKTIWLINCRFTFHYNRLTRIMKKLFLLIATVISISAAAQTKPGYAIDFKVNGLKDTTAYLGYYFAEQAYIRDTAHVNSNGQFSFTGKTALQQGLYFLVLNKSKFIDIVVGHNQHFLVETDTAGLKKPAGNVTVKNDLDNKLYYENLSHLAELSKKADPLVKILRDTTLKDESKKKTAQEALKKINEESQAYQDKIIDEHPETMTGRLFKTTRQVVIPEPPKRADGSIDSLFQLKYYREHFFDNFDLSDDALIRIEQPLYKKKVNEYLDKLYMQHPDTITKAITKLVSKAKKNPETYKFLLITLTSKYGTPEFMGMDEVFVWLYYTYYATGEMDYWANEKHKKNLKEFADNYCKSLIGKTGPNMIMQDVNLQPKSMYDIKAKYTILYFFDHNCGHCRKETPVLVDFYKKNKAKFNVEVFAIDIDSTLADMRAFIKTFGTTWITVNGPRTYLNVHYKDQYDVPSFPTIYILDQNKKIIAKKPPTDKLENFLINYEKVQKQKAASKVKQPDRVPFDCSKVAVKGKTPPKS